MSYRTMENLLLGTGDLIVHKRGWLKVVACDLMPDFASPTVQVVAQTYPVAARTHVRLELDAADYSVLAVNDEPPKPKRWRGQPAPATAVGS